MAKVPLQNNSPWSHIRTVEEASCTVSKWPAWKRERRLFSAEPQVEDFEQLEARIGDLGFAGSTCFSVSRPANKVRSATARVD